MKKYSKILSLILVVIMVLSISITGCKRDTSIDDNTNSGNNENLNITENNNENLAEFDEFTDNLFIEEVSLNTLNLHYTITHPENYGITDYPVVLSNFNIDDLGKPNEELQAALNKIREFDYDSLSASQQLTYDILLEYLERENEYQDVYMFEEPFSPLGGAHNQIPTIFADYRFNNKNDVDEYLELVGEIQGYFNNLIKFEDMRFEQGYVMQDGSLDDTIKFCKDFIAKREDNYLITLFSTKIKEVSGLTEAEITEYIQKNSKLILESVIPAYQSVIDKLTALKGSGKSKGGLCNYDNGKRYYEYLLKYYTGSDKTPEELIEMVEDELESNIMEISSMVIKDSSILDKAQNFSFDASSPDAILDDLIEKMSIDFPNIVTIDYNVKYMDDSVAENMNPAYYLTAPIDDVTHNIIYINGSYYKNASDLYPTLAHEGYPGHLYQTTYFYNTEPSLIRYALNFGGYCEGWGEYSEIYSYKLSGIEENVANVLAENASYSFGLYSRIDLGVNYEGWGLDDTKEFLQTYGIEDSDIAENIYNTIIADPGVYLQYHIGYLEICSLRDKAKKELGESFNLKNFHEFFLNIGPAQYDIIEKYLNVWIQGQ